MSSLNNALRAKIAAINRENLNIHPTVRGNAKKMFGETAMRQYRNALRERQQTIRGKSFRLSPVQVEGGLYNASILLSHSVDMKKLIKSVKERGLIRDDHFHVISCDFKSGRMATKISFRPGHAMEGSENQEVTGAYFRAKDSKGSGISFDIHYTGRVRFSATNGVDPEALRSFFSKYMPLPGHIILNNRVVTFLIRKWVPKLDEMYEALKRGAKFEGLEVEATYKTKRAKGKVKPETFLYVAFNKGLKGSKRRKQWKKEHKVQGDPNAFIAKISSTASDRDETRGYVQIMGTIDEKNAKRRLVRFLKVFRDYYFMERRTKSNSPKREKTPPRLVLPSHVNVPVGNMKMRIGTACPTDRCPIPYGFTGRCPNDGWYVKPNKQGQPCCYKIPNDKRVREIRMTVKKAYDDLGIAIPKQVQDIFGITSTFTSKEIPSKAPNANKITMKNGKIMIGSRSCMRYPLVRLIDIARSMRIKIPAKPNKKDMCALIHAGGPPSPNKSPSPRRYTTPVTRSPSPKRKTPSPKRKTPSPKRSPTPPPVVQLRPTKLKKKIITGA